MYSSTASMSSLMQALASLGSSPSRSAAFRAETRDDGSVVAGELVARTGVSRTSISTSSSSSSSSTMSHLFRNDDHSGHADLAGQQDVLLGLSHRAVGGGDHEDRAVHLSGAGDHVLDVVGVARAVDVRVVTGLGLVLDVRDVDGDTALALLGSLVDRSCSRCQSASLWTSQVLGDRGGQGGLTVVDVTDGTDVDVRLGALELLP